MTTQNFFRHVAFLLLLALQQAVYAKEDIVNPDSDGLKVGQIRINQDPTVNQVFLHGEEALENGEAVYNIHQDTVIVESQPRHGFTIRHEEAKEQLLARMSRDAGKWSSTHPRHRLLDAIYGFQSYYERQKEELVRLKGLYKRVSKSQRALLETHVRYSQQFIETDHLLDINGALCKRIASQAMEFYGIEQKELDAHIHELQKKGQQAEKVSVAQALKHLVRDWAKEGLGERSETFGCMLESLKAIVPDTQGGRAPKILVPGSGLNRLGYDIAAAYPNAIVTVNEWSMYMNLVYRFLEANPEANSASVHPYIDIWSHHATKENMQREIAFPDIPVETATVVLVEGDFTTVFSDKDQAGAYDVVVTYFFIDTARNLLSYFDAIKRLLRPGGHWVNLGPLKYGTAPFVQLALDDIVRVSEAMGFVFLDTDLASCGEPTWPDQGRYMRTIKAVYNFDERALTENAYKAQFWVARKE